MVGRVASPPGSHPTGHAASGVDGASRFDPSRETIRKVWTSDYIIEEAVRAAIRAGLAVNGEYGVAAARFAARTVYEQTREITETRARGDILQVMQERRISQRALAKRIGLSEARVSQMLRPGSNMTLRTVERIWNALGDSDSRSESEDPRSGAEAEGRQSGGAAASPETLNSPPLHSEAGNQ